MRRKRKAGTKARNRAAGSLTTRYESALRTEGFQSPAGVDEAGRGCLAGPVVAAAVILDQQRRINGLQDSKTLTPAKREELDQRIRERARAVAVCAVAPEVVDEINVLQATLRAMQGAVDRLRSPSRREGEDAAPDCVLVDGMSVPTLPIPQRALVGGDRVCASIAAASIVAKVHRDSLMLELHHRYPAYNFASNKGYGTIEHRKALALHGPSPVHRRTFRGVCDPELPLEAPEPPRS